jgi:hypothetical protein
VIAVLEVEGEGVSWLRDTEVGDGDSSCVKFRGGSVPNLALSLIFFSIRMSYAPMYSALGFAESRADITSIFKFK